MFGTPDDPFVLPETGLDQKKLSMAAGSVWSEEDGAPHGLYREHCAHCHGINGDGSGPTALFLNPYPRDYRPAVFKFKSTYNPARPTDDDLRQVLLNGVPGTAMPSFSLLSPIEIDALVEYVKYLSVRGQMETALITYVADELEFDPLTGEGEPLDPAQNPDQRQIIVEELLPEIVASWEEASDNVILPDESALPAEDRSSEELAASVAKGRELFYGTTANCIKCHGPTGLGDGQTDDHNIWNKTVLEFQQQTESLPDQIEALTERIRELDGEEADEARQELERLQSQLAHRQEVVETLFPPRNAIPRNLRINMYRGGRRPLDIFRKVYTGIAGTPMPGGGPAMPGAQGTLTEEQMWQIVDYVRSLPFEPASQPERLRVNYETVN
jgi:mono/diheme cytochrome c family protein